METEKLKENKKPGTEKKALGRGLAALLGGAAEDLEEETTQEAAAPEVEIKEETKKIEVAAEKIEKNEEKIEASVREIEESVKNLPFQKIAIEKISANTEQPRQNFSETKIEELAESIKEQGLIQPIILKKLGEQNYQIVAGERRWRASKLAGLTEIPAIIRDEAHTEEQHDLASIIENVQRVELNPIELSEAYNRILKKYNQTQEELAKKLGISRVSLANTLRLQRLPGDVKDAIVSGRLTEGHGRALLGLEGEKEIADLANLAIEHKLNVRETELRVRSYIEEQKQAKISASNSTNSGSQTSYSAASGNTSSASSTAQTKSSEILAVEDELRSLFGSKINIRGNKKGGTIEIYYANSDSFNRIIHQLRSLER